MHRPRRPDSPLLLGLVTEGVPRSDAWWLELSVALLVAAPIFAGMALAGPGPGRDRSPAAAGVISSSGPSSAAEVDDPSTTGPSSSPQPKERTPLKLNGSGTLRLVEGDSGVF